MKKIQFYNNNFSFFEKPLLILSFLSIPIYVLKLFSVENSDLFFTGLTVITVLSALFLNFRQAKKVKILGLILIAVIVIFVCFYDEILLRILNFSKDNSLKFSTINIVSNTLGFYDFQNYVDFTGFGGSFITNGEIISGAVNIFKNNPESKVVSEFLTARFLLTFSLSGFAFSLIKENKNLLIISLIAIITGNLTPLLLLFLFILPIFYFLSLISSFACGFISSVLSIKSGFYHSPSVFELLICNENKIYSLAVCVFAFCISYYLARLVKERVE